ncbi:MAG: PEP-CTERM sorting domain-containing protein [Goleter apudmare HA4340-LM2]|jgi:hypothetical protein|nr:PEP-CTERM sorting domain-containing protein [Goleter apudmare HA4340-LM2]
MLLNQLRGFSKLFWALGLVSLGLFMAPNPAKAATLIPLKSQDANPGFDDFDFRALINNGDFTELFVAEGRIGNNSTGTGERELGINTATGANVDPGNFAWGNAKVWDFNLEYTGSQVTFKVFDANQTIQLSQAFSGPVTDIYFRTFAQKGNNNNLQNALSLTDLVFNGVSIGSLASASTSTTADVDYFRLGKISTPFTLTGKTSMSWVGTAPSRSNLAFQIKVGTSKSVPEPSVLGAIFGVTIAGATAVKRKKAAIQQVEI